MILLKNLFINKNKSDSEIIDVIYNVFGFKPVNIAPYKLACKHKSIAQQEYNGCKVSNERLEFLGDAILGAVIAEYLFKKFPYREEGFLTEIRSRIVSRQNLNNLSQKLELSRIILSANKCHNKNSISGDAFEAFIGAIYIDKGFEFVKKIIINRIVNCHIDVDELVKTEVNFKSKLIEWGQKNKKNINFVLIDEIEPNGKSKLYTIEVQIDNESFAKASNYSIKRAEQDAAEIACGKLICQ